MRRALALVLLFTSIVCFAQKGVKPIRIELNDTRYLFVKFPTEISYADMGTGNIMAQPTLDKILKLKADKANFDKTNLSVVTTDGKYYSFIVEYNPNPSVLAVDMENIKDSITPDLVIPSSYIEVSDIHTTHIILPAKVADIALGHKEVISEKADPLDNIVKVKSAVREKEKFVETSITVVTVDGKIYPMRVGYEKNPNDMSFSFSDDGTALLRNVNVNDDIMKRMSEWIIKKGQYINDLGAEDNKMVYQLCSVFTDQDIIAFYLFAKNNSKLDYSVDFVKAFISDKRVEKNSVTQDEDLFPIYTYYSNDERVVHGKDGMNIVLFYRKFTIPKTRILNFELYERNGGRNMVFSTSNKVIINAEVMDKNKLD